VAAINVFSRGESPEQLDQELHQVLHTNVIANVHLFNFYLPLVLRGTAKKVIAITSGYADLENVVDGELFEAMPYSTSKAALNMVVTKYAAQYNKDGVLFLALSPGSVDTGELERGRCNSNHERRIALTVSQMQRRKSKSFSFTLFSRNS
jgi:NAD(P)-dependent dehydrogenase (short-subunit alcohol dehydrogenase family)